MPIIAKRRDKVKQYYISVTCLELCCKVYALRIEYGLRGEGGMWTGVYMAQDMETAEKVRDLLEENEILARVRENGSSFEVMVPSSEIDEAHAIILGIKD